ncbi:S-layer protein [Paenibacillus sp. VT-400]|uniref:S-layer homology domain-containing protein n=1 Tax=Paenibacillus sp. VT-400 TaxID=1495853 RepID=UPI00064B3429|nr:S-layer homology domain-containing protein [Paenibacillus sp. VT-400]KLU56095.1 S-layer protein [Paenibacillus sp. VT-400]
MKKQIKGHEKKKKRNGWIVGLLTTAVLVGTLLLVGPVHLTSTANAASGTSDTALSKFKDIKGHWAQATIAKAYEKNLISGYQDGTFRPNGKITRGEYATILARATGLEKVEGQNPFADLKGHWSEAAVSQLVGQGFINADDYAKGFNPNAELTRYEMMKWIANGLIKSGTSFQDAFNDTKNTLLPTPEVNRGTIRAEQIPYLALVRGTGIVGGFQDGTLKPADSTTRAEVSAILLRYMDVEGTDAGKYSDLNEMREVGTTGTNLTTISNYKYSSGSIMISDLSKGNINLSNKSGVLKIHRFIVVDATQNKSKGIYAKLFLPDKYASGSYRTFADVSFTSNLEASNLITFNQGLSDSLIQFNRLDLDLAKKQSNVTIPMDSGELIKKGLQKRFWTTSTLRNKSWSYFLKSDAEGEFKIQR